MYTRGELGVGLEFGWRHSEGHTRDSSQESIVFSLDMGSGVVTPFQEKHNVKQWGESGTGVLRRYDEEI